MEWLLCSRVSREIDLQGSNLSARDLAGCLIAGLVAAYTAADLMTCGLMLWPRFTTALTAAGATDILSSEEADTIMLL